MKCILKIVVVLTSIISFSSLAMNSQGVCAQELSKIKIKSGIDHPNKVISEQNRQVQDLMMHKAAFAGTLGRIAAQGKVVHDKQSQEAKLKYVMELLPETLRRREIVVLAQTLGFTHSDDAAVRAKRFMGLGLLARDMYDPDNQIARNLGFLATSPSGRLHQQEIIYYVTESFEYALRSLESMSVPADNAIDFNLSYAQVLLWRLYYGGQSLVHSLTDFRIDGTNVFVGERRTEIYSAILYHLEQAETLIKSGEAALPVIYNRTTRMVAKSLTRDQIFDLIQMHKDEIDAVRLAPAKDKFEELQRIRGFADDENNPLDHFTSEVIDEVKEKVRTMGISDEKMPSIVYNYMKVYSVNRVKDVEKYFTQDVLQRYLLRAGLVSRATFEGILMDKVEQVRTAANRLMNM